jgi:hypothetical protein
MTFNHVFDKVIFDEVITLIETFDKVIKFDFRCSDQSKKPF